MGSHELGGSTIRGWWTVCSRVRRSRLLDRHTLRWLPTSRTSCDRRTAAAVSNCATVCSRMATAAIGWFATAFPTSSIRTHLPYRASASRNARKRWLGVAALRSWRCAIESRRGFWPNEQLEPRCSFDGIGFSWRSTAEDPWLATPRLHRRITAIELELRVFAPGVACEAGEGQVFWLGCGDFEFAEERSVRFSLRNDGEFHVYRVVLAAIPALPELVEWLRLDLANGPAEIDLRALRLR